MKKNRVFDVQGNAITTYSENEMDFISLTDMLKAKDGDFFISDWLRNRNTVEFLGIWEKIHNPDFNYGEFATIRNQAGLNSYKISVKEWVAKTKAVGLVAKAGRILFPGAARWRPVACLDVATTGRSRISTGKVCWIPATV